MKTKVVDDNYRPNHLARLISATYRHQLAYLSRNLEPYRLGGGSYIYLLYIMENPGITQSELSTRLFIDRATVSKMVSYLEKEGMITRRPNPADGRAVILDITPHGETVYGELTRVATQYRQLMVADIPTEDCQVTIRTLRKILDRLQQANARDKDQE